MKQLTILVPEGQNNISSIVGPIKYLTGPLLTGLLYWRERDYSREKVVLRTGRLRGFVYHEGSCKI